MTVPALARLGMRLRQTKGVCEVRCLSLISRCLLSLPCPWLSTAFT